MKKEYAKFATDKAIEALGIDSPTGYTKEAVAWTKKQFEALGFKSKPTVKGGIIVDLGGKDAKNALYIQVHIDTLGAMVSEIKENGRLKVSRLGGLQASNCETEHVRVRTRSGKVVDGTFQIENASAHVNGKLGETVRTFDNMEVVLDEDVTSKEDTKKLGIDVGDFVCFEPRACVTKSGYIKSRFLDDKLSVGIMLGFAKYLKDTKATLKRRVYVHISVYEEVGHGGAASVPEGVTDSLSIDMGCVGEGLNCTERQVSICVKDSRTPYNYDMVGELIAGAKKEKADYALDVYPFYGSDVDVTLEAGHDIRHGLCGAGVYASHGYERSHVDGVHNTLKLLKGYLGV